MPLAVVGETDVPPIPDQKHPVKGKTLCFDSNSYVGIYLNVVNAQNILSKIACNDYL